MFFFFIEIEDGLHRLGVLIINSTNTLKHLRMRCSKLKNKIRSCQENVSEKSLLISQLEEAIKHLGKVKIYPCQNLSVIKSQNLSAYNILYIKLFLIRTNVNFIFTKK